MDVPTLMYNLREEVTCSVCMQLYTNPKQLPCLHVFCLQCLNNLARTSARYGKIKCPLCQRDVAVPESGTLETLPNCFHMKNLLDILAIKECNNAKVTCENCERKSEEAAYCFHCGKFWCNECMNAHNIFRENKDHRVLALKDFEDKDFEDVLKRPVFCQKELHDREVLKFYCKECDIPVCHTCVIVDHSKHDVEHLELTAREVKKSITSKLAAVRETSEEIYYNYNTGEEKKSRQIDDCTDNNKQRIRQTVKSLVSILHQKEEELIAEVENERTIAREELRKSADAFQDFLRKREECISNIGALVERSTGADLVRTSTKKTIDELFQGLQEQQDMPATTERIVHSKVFVKNQAVSTVLEESVIGRLEQSLTEAKQCFVDDFRSATAGLAKEIEVTTRNSEREQYYCAGDYITVQLISVNEDLNINCIAEEAQIVDWQNGRYTVSFIPNESGQHSLSVQVNGENITKFLPVEIKERCFEPLRFIGAEGAIEGLQLSKPWGVTANDSNEIFVSYMNNNRIVVFNENGEFIRSFGENSLHCPNGVLCDNMGRIFVTSRNDNKILVFGQRGEYISTFHNGNSLSEPRGISFDADGNLIVCDTGNKCVRFFSPEGNIFKTIGAGRLRMPFDCVCYKGKLFVSDLDAHLIKVYNSNGRFLNEFGTHGTGDGELNHPTGLAVDKMGHLLVCSLNNHRVQVFTLSGKFVAKFGEYGKELGQIFYPSSVSVLKNGRIVVCEFENRRLQIFE